MTTVALAAHARRGLMTPQPFQLELNFIVCVTKKRGPNHTTNLAIGLLEIIVNTVTCSAIGDNYPCAVVSQKVPMGRVTLPKKYLLSVSGFTTEHSCMSCLQRLDVLEAITYNRTTSTFQVPTAHNTLNSTMSP